MSSWIYYLFQSHILHKLLIMIITFSYSLYTVNGINELNYFLFSLCSLWLAAGLHNSRHNFIHWFLSLFYYVLFIYSITFHFKKIKVKRRDEVLLWWAIWNAACGHNPFSYDRTKNKTSSLRFICYFTTFPILISCNNAWFCCTVIP